jgi:hypothetical protein
MTFASFLITYLGESVATSQVLFDYNRMFNNSMKGLEFADKMVFFSSAEVLIGYPFNICVNSGMRMRLDGKNRWEVGGNIKYLFHSNDGIGYLINNRESVPFNFTVSKSFAIQNGFELRLGLATPLLAFARDRYNNKTKLNYFFYLPSLSVEYLFNKNTLYYDYGCNIGNFATAESKQISVKGYYAHRFGYSRIIKPYAKIYVSLVGSSKGIPFVIDAIVTDYLFKFIQLNAGGSFRYKRWGWVGELGTTTFRLSEYAINGGLLVSYDVLRKNKLSPFLVVKILGDNIVYYSYQDNFNIFQTYSISFGLKFSLQ